jgi:membrane carboxypeptidase/penicillin-binding protein PbpC
VVRQSDALSLHAPLTAETEGIVDAALLAQAKPGLVLVNAGRGKLVSLDAVYDALRSGLVRAFAADVSGRSLQGGSTITQQYVKNALLSSDRTVTRKVKELFVAVKLEQHHSKDEILESYLNTIFFGRGAYGIEAASRAWFGKDVRKLTVAEGAVLAGVINAPLATDPARGGRERLGRRFRFVLDGMVKMGALSPQAAAAQRLPRILRHQPAVMSGSRGYLIDALEQELKARGIPTAVHYPLSLHQQPAYAAQHKGQSFPVAEKLAREVISLPMSADLREVDQDTIVRAIGEALRVAA